METPRPFPIPKVWPSENIPARPILLPAPSSNNYHAKVELYNHPFKVLANENIVMVMPGFVYGARDNKAFDLIPVKFNGSDLQNPFFGEVPVTLAFQTGRLYLKITYGTEITDAELVFETEENATDDDTTYWIFVAEVLTNALVKQYLKSDVFIYFPSRRPLPFEVELLETEVEDDVVVGATIRIHKGLGISGGEYNLVHLPPSVIDALAISVPEITDPYHDLSVITNNSYVWLKVYYDKVGPINTNVDAVADPSYGGFTVRLQLVNGGYVLEGFDVDNPYVIDPIRPSTISPNFDDPGAMVVHYPIALIKFDGPKVIIEQLHVGNLIVPSIHAGTEPLMEIF